MGQTIESKNKALVLEAFDTLFNKRDYAAAERFGHHVTSNTALISRLVAMACSVSLRAFRRRLGMNQERLWPKGTLSLARALFGHRPAGELDCGGHSSNEGWDSRGALGCDSRRGHARVVQERPSHVRRQVWG